MGLLYATGARQPVLVHVPLHRRVSVFHALCDLEIDYWVDLRAHTQTSSIQFTKLP
jgi:hypothetical protein